MHTVTLTFDSKQQQQHETHHLLPHVLNQSDTDEAAPPSGEAAACRWGNDRACEIATIAVAIL